MQSLLNLSSHGVPLCLSPISARFPLSKQIRDHDRRREAMKRRFRSQSVTPQAVLAMRMLIQNAAVAQAAAQDLPLDFRSFEDDDAARAA
ncbi:hypothetical protein V2J09_020851 [Rumex salicifolius]